MPTWYRRLLTFAVCFDIAYVLVPIIELRMNR